MTTLLPIELVLFDVDGVLTDGSLHFDGSGEAIKSFSAKDGIAVSLLKSFGAKVGVLSGKDSPALRRRCQELDFDIVMAGIHDKLPVFQNLLARLELRPQNVAFVGDDVNDIMVLNLVDHSYAPSDAHALVLSTVKHVCQARGGQGVAREVAEDLLFKAGLSLSDMYARYLDVDKQIKFVQ